MNPPVVGTAVVDSSVGVVVKLEETAFAVVVVIFSVDLQTGLVVDEMETGDVVAELNETEIVKLFVKLSIQALQHCAVQYLHDNRLLEKMI